MAVITGKRNHCLFQSEYNFTEAHSDQALQIGSDGDLPHRSAQGIWFKMTVPKLASEDASDDFEIGVLIDDIA